MQKSNRGPRRLLAIVTAAALVAGASLVATAPANAAESVTIADPKLESCVENALSALGGLGTLLNTLTLGLLGSLSCVGQGVIDVAGLQNVGGLSTLDLRDNSISTVSVLSTLSSVGNLKLDGNGLIDLSPLAGVHGLLFTPLSISALDQSRTLAPVATGVTRSIPVIRNVDGTVIMPTISTAPGAATGVVDTVNRTVTWLTDGVGELLWSVGDFTGTLTTLVSSLSTPAYPVATPVVSGSAVVGGTLAASGGADLSYQWYRHANQGDSSGAAIAGATGSGYVPVVADLGLTLSVVATGAGDGYTTAAKRSARSGAIATGTVPQSPVPTVSGSASLGSTLTATVGAWTPGTTLAYRWTRTGGSGARDIPGATGTSYTVTAADLGAVMTFRVTGTAPGYETARTSAPTSAVTATPAPSTPDPTESPLPSPSPSTTGTTSTGTTSTPTDSASIGTGAPATSPSSTTVTPVKARASTVTKSFTRSPAPRISGSPTVGRTLTAKVTTWVKGAKYGYQWKAAGKKIAKATGKTYRVAAKYAGKRITVTVTGRLDGYRTLAKTSRSTGRIAK